MKRADADGGGNPGRKRLSALAFSLRGSGGARSTLPGLPG